MSNVIRGAFKDPKSKADLVDKMMSRDFDGDLRSLAVDGDLKMERIRPHVIQLKFGHSGKVFELGVRMPRQEIKVAAQASKRNTSKKSAPIRTGRSKKTNAEQQPHQETGTG